MSPLLTIWIKPRETFNQLGERSLAGKENHIELLFALATLCICLPGFPKMFNLNDEFILSKIIMTIAFLPIIGMIFFKYILSYLTWKLGKILHGNASFAEVQLVMAYSMTPSFLHLVIAFLFIIPALLLGDVDMILLQHPVTYFVIWIFTSRNLVYGLSRFNHFTYGYAILNFVIVTALIEIIRSFIVK